MCVELIYIPVHARMLVFLNSSKSSAHLSGSGKNLDFAVNSHQSSPELILDKQTILCKFKTNNNVRPTQPWTLPWQIHG